MKRNAAMPIRKPSRYRNKETQSDTGMLRYLPDMMDAGIQMPMHSYA
jgi:hypothetical protein